MGLHLPESANQQKFGDKCTLTLGTMVITRKCTLVHVVVRYKRVAVIGDKKSQLY
jgi:hypothetical protein